MAYLGNRPAEAYSAFQKQDFSTSATTSYTLDHPVSNQNEIALFINFVRQEPTTAYTASGTSLTLTSATSASDDMYCVYLGQAKQTVNAPDGSVGTSQLASEAVTNAKVASSIITGQTAETSVATDDLILLSDTSASGALKKMTRANFVSGVGGTNTPAFHAYNNADQNITVNTETQLIFNTEIYDTDSAYASNTFTVPSGEGGRYFVYFRLGFASGSDFTYQITLKINDSFNADSGFRVNQLNDYYDNHFSGQVLNLSAGDTLKLYIYADSNGNISGTENRANFGAYKIIE